MIELEPCATLNNHFTLLHIKFSCADHFVNPCPDDIMLKTETTYTLHAPNFKSEYRSGAIQSFLQNPVQVKALKERNKIQCMLKSVTDSHNPMDFTAQRLENKSL